ncbi:MAG: restriction endonuclease-like protein [Oscillospiraceae bacterium]|nr:restriction endonuclease-like protein [Oscillospiraceae bacterium]
MGSLPTGSDKLLEIQAGNIYVVIKSKNPHPNLTNQNILRQPSELRVTGVDVNSIRIFGEEKIAADNGGIGASSYSISTSPLFFEQTDYEIIIRSRDGKSVSLWHENYSVRDRISPVTDFDDLISGIVNFGNSAGFSEFEISHDGKKSLVVRIEVFPSKISYKEDYQDMLQDISNEIAGAVLDFMRNTYQEFSIGSTQSTVPALFFEIIRRIFDKFQNAVNTIISSPHHKLYLEHPVVPAHKVKKIDNQTIRWLQKHPEHVIPKTSGYTALKAPTVKKQITYNTLENQFTKFILKSTIKKLKDFRDRYSRSTRKPEDSVLSSVDTMTAALNKFVNTTFLREVDDYKATQSMSLVFEMAPGYRELYKYYLMMQRGLTVHGDVFRMSLKDTAQLYEYWCFIKLVTLLKRNYHLASSDVIKVDTTGVTISLVKGKKSEVKFINPRTGEIITLAYNPGEQNTQTVNQKPDNVLTLEKKGTDVPYMYVFDAKYRIENNPSDPFYPDSNPGPKVSDINTMHRYRDSIVYENTESSRFMFEKKMFGAYVLFPYDDPNGEYKDHRFYKSIETVNIGGLPFLPGTTELLENFLSELVADSSESAFERASLPRGIEERLSKTDWSVRDVMVGSLGSVAQFEDNIKRRYYYVPAKYIKDSDLPIRYIALYQSKNRFKEYAGVRYYGEVTYMQKVKRKDIDFPISRNNGNEMYYAFRIKAWKTLPAPIAVKDEWVNEPKFTSLFLLEHSQQSFELFNIHSEEEYRLMMEINKAFDNLSTSTADNNAAVYRINDSHAVIVADGNFTITNNTGDILGSVSISNFARSPRAGFREIKRLLQ